MPFIDTATLAVVERRPGWHGRYFHSPSMSFARYDFTEGSTIHEHSHPQEEVWQVIEGELEMTIDGETRTARAGVVAIVPGGAPHSARALSGGRAIVVDHPLRPDIAGDRPAGHARPT